MQFPSFFRVLQNKEQLHKIFPLSLMISIYAFSLGLIYPIFSIYVNNITKDIFLTGIILSLWGLGGILFSIPSGFLVDSFSHKQVIRISLCIKLVTLFAMTLISTFWSLFIIYFIYSVSAAIFWVAVWSYLFSNMSKKTAGEEFGFFSTFYDLAYTLSPFLTGFLSAILFFLPFYISCFLLSLAILMTLFFDGGAEKSKVQKPLIPLIKKEVKMIIKNRNFVIPLLLFIIFSYASLNVVYSFLPIILESYNFSYVLIGVIVAISWLPSSLLEIPVGYIIDSFKKQWLIFLSVAIFSLSVLLMAFFKDFYSIFFIMIIIGFLNVIFVNIIHSIASIFLFDKEKGVFSGIMTFTKDIGNVLGPFLGGLSLKIFGIQITFLLLSVISLMLALPFFWLFSNDVD